MSSEGQPPPKDRAAGRALAALGVVSLLVLGFALVLRPGPRAQREVTAPVPSVEAAWAAVHASPRDPTLWNALGEAQEAEEQLEAAEHAYRTAIRLGGDTGLAYARLGFLLYARGDDAQALPHLLEAKRRGAVVPMLDFTIERLAAQHRFEAHDAGAADSEAGPARVSPSLPRQISDAGASLDAETAAPVEASSEPGPGCSLPVTRAGKGRVYLVDLLIDDVPTKLVMDTGASMTVITSELASRASARLDPHRHIRAITANGSVEFAAATVERVELAGRLAETVTVAICEDCVQDFADGLLGLDLQAAFGMTLDLAKERVLFSDCDPN